MYADATCYAGQLVAVVSDTTTANNGLYLITANPAFKAGSAKSAANSPFVAVQYSSAAAVEAAIAGMAGVLKFMGVLPNGSALSMLNVKKGYAWLVTADTGSKLDNGQVLSYGVLDYAGVHLEAGDLVICISGESEKSFSSIAEAEVPSVFAVINKNIDGSVNSVATSSTDAELVAFDGTTGRQVKGAGQTLSALKSECKNMANATGTLSVAHGGTGATTVAGAKTALGIDTLELDVAALKDGTTAAGKASKLATARTLAFQHPVLGNLAEFSGNSFDGSKNMAAKAVDGVYTGLGIPSVITTDFPSWAYQGELIVMRDAARDAVRGWVLTKGSDCGTLMAQLARFLRIYIDGSLPVALMQVTAQQFVGEAIVNGRKCIVSVVQRTENGEAQVVLFVIDRVSSSYIASNFKAVIEALEGHFTDLSALFPAGTEFVCTDNGTTYLYTGYSDNVNSFVADTWL